METPHNIVSQKEFEVTGVSRSGRVRKKSSKLLDFQSIDDVDKKAKRISKQNRSISSRSSLPIGIGTPKSRRALDEINLSDEFVGNDEGLPNEFDFDDDVDVAVSDSGLELVKSIGDPNSDDELDELVADLVEGVEAESIEHSVMDNDESPVKSSLYMTEKSNKRKMLRDGKVITSKMERKDKGKTRFTAYSLWAKEVRKSSKLLKTQDTARRLGELWANVSNKEKSSWRRKAKMQAAKAKQIEERTKYNSPPKGVNQTNSSFQNRPTTSRTRKLAAEKQKVPVPAGEIKPGISTDAAFPIISKRKKNTQKPNAENHIKLNVSLDKPNNSGESIIEPIDAAAHLKLLGESLTIIGDRLKEHDGQIAVSGSLSVLLDSLLCSIGPLLCLTTHLPGFKNKKPLRDNLAATLDNIAYVMPGL